MELGELDDVLRATRQFLRQRLLICLFRRATAPYNVCLFVPWARHVRQKRGFSPVEAAGLKKTS